MMGGIIPPLETRGFVLYFCLCCFGCLLCATCGSICSPSSGFIKARILAMNFLPKETLARSSFNSLNTY